MNRNVYVVKFGNNEETDTEVFDSHDAAWTYLAGRVSDRWDDVMSQPIPDDEEEALEEFCAGSSSFEQGDVTEYVLRSR